MTCDWLDKWIEFQYQGSLVRLQGMLLSEPNELKEISTVQVIKWNKGNDLWATVLLEPANKPDSMIDKYIQTGIPKHIKDLIQEFGEIF
jgi:hypothetical protein